MEMWAWGYSQRRFKVGKKPYRGSLVKLTGRVRSGVSGHISNSPASLPLLVQLLAQICRLVFQWSIQRSEILSPYCTLCSGRHSGKSISHTVVSFW